MRRAIRLKGWRRILPVAALCFGAAGSWCVAPAGAQPSVASIEAIDFKGNASISDGRLRGAMRLKQPVWWNPFRSTPFLGNDYLTQDLYRVLEVYRDQGFPFATIQDAAVRVIEEGKKVAIEVTIDEGPQVRITEVRLEGVDRIHVDEVREKVEIERGDLLSRSALLRARNGAEEYYAEAGRLTTRVRTDAQIEGRSAKVFVRVTEGPVYTMRSVVIDTSASLLERTDRNVVTREIDLKPGEAVRTSRILRTQERLFDTGVFRTARVIPVPDSGGAPVADIHIMVHERSSGWYGFGAGYSSDDRFRLLAEWGNRNLAGTARRLEANGDIAFSLDRQRGRSLPVKSGQVRLRYTEGWVFGTRTRSQTALSHSYERLTSTTDEGEVVFDQDITAFEELLSRNLGRFSIIGFGITNKWVRSGDPTVADQTYVTRNVSATLEEDRRNDLLDPSDGSIYRGVAEYAGGLLGGTTEFSRWTILGSWYFPLGQRTTIGTRFRAGLIIPVGRGVSRGEDALGLARIPIEERFRLGGGTTVRGYGENSLGRIDTSDVALGGTTLLLANVEFRFPIVWILRGAVFFDAGNVWADVDEVKLRRFGDGFSRSRRGPLNVAYGLGGGLRIMTPVGPFRADYGWKLGGGQRPGLRPGELHLSLGQAF